MFYFLMEWLVYPIVFLLIIGAGSLIYLKGKYDCNSNLVSLSYKEGIYTIKTPTKVVIYKFYGGSSE